MMELDVIDGSLLLTWMSKEPWYQYGHDFNHVDHRGLIGDVPITMSTSSVCVYKDGQHDVSIAALNAG